MSWLSQGPLTAIIGLGLAVIVPFGGMFVIAIGIVMTYCGSQSVQPGIHRNRCKWGGHDWRKNLPNYPAGTICRNCLRLKGTAYAYSVPSIPFLPPTYQPQVMAATGYPGYASPPVDARQGAPSPYPPYAFPQAAAAQPAALPPIFVASPVGWTANASNSVPTFCPYCNATTRPEDLRCSSCRRPVR